MRNYIIERLQTALATEKLLVKDNSELHSGHSGNNGGGHYAVTIVSDKFQGKSAVERHRMIYAALGDVIGKEIHAISINAYTTTEAASKPELL